MKNWMIDRLRAWPVYLFAAIFGGLIGLVVTTTPTGFVSGLGIAIGVALVVDVFNIKAFA